MDDFPAKLQIVADDGKVNETVTAKQLSGSDVSQVYDGVLEMHRHILTCVRENRPARSSLQDALKTMQLVARIEQGER
jgi:hypothetical protein